MMWKGTRPAWLADELSLLAYLTSTHPGHPDLLEATALVTSWLLVAGAVFGLFAVLIDAVIRL